MPLYGPKPPLVVNIGPIAAAGIAVDVDYFILPPSLGQYRVKSIQATQDVPSSSGTFLLRYITDDSAAGAAANGTTIVDLCTAFSTAGADDTVVTATLANVTIPAGARIAGQTGGTQTNLVGFRCVALLEPIDQL